MLAVEPSVEVLEAGITPDGAITRYNLEGRAALAPAWPRTGAVLAEGEATAFTGYSATGTTVATRAAEAEDARERLMVLLADEIVDAAPAAASGGPALKLSVARRQGLPAAARSGRGGARSSRARTARAWPRRGPACCGP